MGKSSAIFFWKPEQEHGYLGQWFTSRFISTESDGSQVIYENTEQQVLDANELL
jgi:hypothetical protein